MEKSLGDSHEAAWEETAPIEALEDDEGGDAEEVIEALPDEDEHETAAVFQFPGSHEVREAVDTTQVKSVDGVEFTSARIAQEISLMNKKLSEGMSIEDMRMLLESDLEEVEAVIEELDDDQQTVLRDEVARRDAILAKLAYLHMIDAAEAAK